MKAKIIFISILVLALVGGFIFYKPKKEVSPHPAPQEEAKPAPEISPLPVEPALPEAVEAKRQAIYRAALSRDYGKLAAEAPSDIFYSFGGAYEGGFAGYLELSAKDEGKSAFDIIPALLRLPYAYTNGAYIWPSVATTPASEWTEEDIAMLRTFLPEEYIKSFREFGGYIYYRLGIDSEGIWDFYVAGD